MNEFPIATEGINPKEYWLIQVSGMEAFWLMSELVAPVVAKLKEKDMPILLQSFNKTPIYMLRKKFFTAEMVAKTTGLKPEDVVKANIIKLIVEERTDLPKPTVNYWGKA